MDHRPFFGLICWNAVYPKAVFPARAKMILDSLKEMGGRQADVVTNEDNILKLPGKNGRLTAKEPASSLNKIRHSSTKTVIGKFVNSQIRSYENRHNPGEPL